MVYDEQIGAAAAELDGGTPSQISSGVHDAVAVKTRTPTAR
jgi:hypothetical protein